MWPDVTRTLMRCTGGALVLLLLVVPAKAQQPLEQRLENLEKQNDEFRKQVQLLQQQNQQLQELMKNMPSSPVALPGGGQEGPAAPKLVTQDAVKDIVKNYLSEQDQKKKEAERAAEAVKQARLETEGYRIGSALNMSVNWRDGVILSTPNDDFTMHIGGWTQYDNVWWGQSRILTTPKGPNAGAAQGVLSGASVGGINDLEDGMYFRRIRYMMDGKFWENYEYTLILALENITFATIGLDEFWVGATNIPYLGTIRAGHIKAAHGLEADMTASSRTMTFMERSSYSEAILNNLNFVTGLWLGNNYLDQRFTWSSNLARADNGGSTGAFFGDGQYLGLLRLTGLPIYEADGRHLMHLGVSGGWFKAQNSLGNPPVVSPNNFHNIQLRARPELRDDVPAGGFPNGNSNRLIDTGMIACDSRWELGTELLYVRGPLSLQAEYGFTWLENVQGQFTGTALTPKTVGGNQSYMFNGGYVQLAYSLTGENRSYDKRLGRLDTYYFGRRGPFTNAWFVRDENGHLNWGWGAWELAARYSYVNLNYGTGANRIQGGIMDGLSVGLNWYLNTNLKVQFDWIYDRRGDLPTGPSAATSSQPGFTNGFGTRMQFMW
jgi:phosphate-selective porin OprO and OprP